VKLHEALASGRRFRLKTSPELNEWQPAKVMGTVYWTTEAVLSDDWEVEPEPKKPLELWAVLDGLDNLRYWHSDKDRAIDYQCRGRMDYRIARFVEVIDDAE
jgi:hypothetical protein